VFWKLFFNFFYICFSLKILINKKHFTIKKKINFISKIVISFYFLPETLFRSYKKFRNIMLFTDYIKFDPRTFNCYIFYFESFFFKFHPLEFDLIWFLYQLWSLFLSFLFVFLLSLIDFFLSIRFSLYFFIVIYFIWNNLWNNNFLKILLFFNFFIS
jgi:hypothetical protein